MSVFGGGVQPAVPMSVQVKPTVQGEAPPPTQTATPEEPLHAPLLYPTRPELVIAYVEHALLMH